MGRKSRDKNETEHLKGIIRNLESENKQLRKQLARADKEFKKVVEVGAVFAEEVVDTASDFIPEANSLSGRCPKCGKKTKGLELGPKVLYTCTSTDCGYRKTYKK